MPDTTADAPAYDPNLYRYDQLPKRFADLDAIDDDALAFFHENGYLVIDRALDAAEVESGSDAIWDLIDGHVEGFKGLNIEASQKAVFERMSTLERRRVIRKVFNFVGFEPRLRGFAEHAGLLDVVGRLMGDTPELFQDMAMLKPAGVGSEKPWHQDCAYFNVPADTMIIGVWVAIDEATTDNGCMHVIPGSHRDGPMAHFKRRDWQICDSDVAVAGDVVVPLDPGGCLIWHGLTHHGSPANTGGRGRRALQYHYKPSRAEKISSEERLGIYGGEGLGATC